MSEDTADYAEQKCSCECCDHKPDTEAFLRSFKDGTFEITPPEWFGPLFVGAFQQTLDAHDAPNYLEMRLQSHVDPGKQYALILCRPGRPSPHELRRQAEAERDILSAALRRACDDAWADGESAYRSYLAGEAPDA